MLADMPQRQSTSNTRFPVSASHRLHNLQFVGIDDLDLGLAAHESRDANVRQRRSELNVIRPEFPRGALFLQRVTGIK